MFTLFKNCSGNCYATIRDIPEKQGLHLRAQGSWCNIVSLRPVVLAGRVGIDECNLKKSSVIGLTILLQYTLLSGPLPDCPVQGRW